MEIKVYKIKDENDSYVELWKECEGERIFGRYTYGACGTWYTVCDPFGYCELNTTIRDDVVFVVCDKNGKEFYRYSNADENPVPKFEDVARKKWAEVAKNNNLKFNVENFERNFWTECYDGTTTLSINKWLLSFKDPDLYKEANDYDENWTGCWHQKEIEYRPLPNSEFEYLGDKYQFTAVRNKHDHCGREWWTFECTDAPFKLHEKFRGDRDWIISYMNMGNVFDANDVGTMYDQRTARDMVMEALKKEYPLENKWQELLLIKRQDRKYSFETFDYTARKLSYRDMADYLIGGNYHRVNIDSVVANVKRDDIYIATRENKALIKEKFSNIYAYDYCLY